MRVAFVGKGGSGKTTLSCLVARHLASRGHPVLAVDADINQHLGAALGLAGEPPALATRLPRIKDYLRGSNAAAWASSRAGRDLREQIDPEFRLGPPAQGVAAGGAVTATAT